MMKNWDTISDHERRNTQNTWKKHAWNMKKNGVNTARSTTQWGQFRPQSEVHSNAQETILYWYLETPTSVKSKTLSWHHFPPAGKLDPSIRPGRGTLQVPNVQRQLKEVEVVDVVDVWISVLKRVFASCGGSNFSSFSKPWASLRCLGMFLVFLSVIIILIFCQKQALTNVLNCSNIYHPWKW